MKKYLIKINGIHCSGCVNLIAMLLDEKNFRNVFVDIQNNTGTFETDKPEEEIKKLLDEVFEEAGEKYTYTELEEVKA